MIEPMKAVTVVVAASAEGSVLATLRELAVLHLRREQPPDKATLSKLREEEALLDRAAQLARANVRHGAERSFYDRSAPADPDMGLAAARELVDVHERIERLEMQAAVLREQICFLWQLGLSDPSALTELSRSGAAIEVRRMTLNEWARLPSPGARELTRDDRHVWCVVFGQDPNTPLPGQPVNLPDVSRAALEQHFAALDEELEKLTEKRDGLARWPERFAAARHRCHERLQFAQAKEAHERLGPVAALRGYCPARSIGTLRRAALEHDWMLQIRDPGQDDDVPTLLRHNRLSRLFQPVMNFLGLSPGYREFHTHGVFLVFFTLFFAMIIGDAGYGLLMLLTTIVIARRRPAVPRTTLTLSGLLACATIAWGAAAGVWFGIERLAGQPPFEWFVVPGLDAWVKENHPRAMRFCLALGVVHLLLARMWSAARRHGNDRIAELGWGVVVLGAGLAAFKLLLDDGQWLPPAICFGLGAGLIVGFSEQQPGRPWHVGLGMGLLRLPLHFLSFVSAFSDAVSYIRLFAVGLATLEVAAAFNNIAAGIGWHSVTAAVGASLIVILGHTVNLLLAAMGVLVHGIRLNLLEFSRNLGMAWVGTPYDPFRPLDEAPLDKS